MRTGISKEVEEITCATCFLSPKLEGRGYPQKNGMGVFAARPVSEGELVAVWGGEVFTREDLENVPPERRRLAIQIDEGFYLFSGREGPADWINHSCAPNCGMRGSIALVAMRDIATGEEVCMDYAMCDGSTYDEFECNCGETCCRKRITGDDWRLPELWVRYCGYFSPYLQRRIDRTRAAGP